MLLVFPWRERAKGPSWRQYIVEHPALESGRDPEAMIAADGAELE
jgi:hypothetical protein